MSTNLYGINLWQWRLTYLVNEKREIHAIHRPWLAFVGTDLPEEPFDCGSYSSCSSVADSVFTGTHLKYCKIWHYYTHVRLYYRCVNFDGENLVKFWLVINFARFLLCQNFSPYGTST